MSGDRGLSSTPRGDEPGPDGRLESRKPVRRPSLWRSVARNAGIRVLILPVSAVLGILSTRLIIDHLGADAFGQYGLLVGIATLFPFADLGMSAALINTVAKADDPATDETVLRVAVTAIRVLIASASVLLLITGAITVTGSWSTLLGSGLLSGTGGRTAAICLALIAVGIPVGLGDRALTGLGKNHVSIIVQGLSSPFVLALLFVVVSVAHSVGPYIAAIPFGVTFLLAFTSSVIANRNLGGAIRRAVRMAPRLRTFRGSRVSDVAWPMLIQMIALPLAMQTDRLVLSHVSTQSALAEYNLASQMYNPVWQVVSAAGLVLWPIFAKQRARSDSAGVSPRPVSLGFGAGSAAICALITVLSGWLAHLASGGKIHLPILLILAFSTLMIMQAIKFPLGMYMTDAKGLRFQALLIVLLLPVNLGLSIVLAGPLGPAGPVIGSAVGVFCCQVVANWWYVSRRMAEYERPVVDDAVNDEVADMLVAPAAAPTDKTFL